MLESEFHFNGKDNENPAIGRGKKFCVTPLQTIAAELLSIFSISAKIFAIHLEEFFS